MSGGPPELDVNAAARGLGEFARNVTDGYNGGTSDAPVTATGATDTGNGDAPPPPPTPEAPPPGGQSQNWLMDMLAQKFGFSSGQDFMSGIIDMLFGKFDLSGIPIIGDLFSRGGDTTTAGNETDGPADDTTVVVADNTTPTGALDTASERVRTDYDAAAGPGATDVATVDPALIPDGPGNNGQG